MIVEVIVTPQIECTGNTVGCSNKFATFYQLISISFRPNSPYKDPDCLTNLKFGLPM